MHHIKQKKIFIILFKSLSISITGNRFPSKKYRILIKIIIVSLC